MDIKIETERLLLRQWNMDDIDDTTEVMVGIIALSAIWG